MGLPMRTRLAVLAGRAVSEASRRLGTGQGSAIGGRVTLAVDSRALELLAAGRRVGLVSGTNGKTTTTRLLAAALGTAGEVSTNSAGANLLSGIVGTLSSPEAGLRGPNAETGLRGPNAETGLRGPNAETGLRGPNAEAGLRGPNAEAGLRGPNAETG